MNKKILFCIFLCMSALLFSADVQHSGIPQKSDPVLVWIAETGTKYHKRDCRTLKNSTTVKSIAIEEAIKLGYEACKVCKPKVEQ